MPRQNVSLTPPNDQWLEARVAGQEFSSESDVVSGFIRRAREVEAMRARLIRAGKSGFTDLGRDDEGRGLHLLPPSR